MRPKFLLFYTGLFLAGALFPLSLAPFSYWLMAIASLAVLFASLTGQTAKELFKRAATFGFGMFGTGVSWVFISMHSFGDVSLLLALIGTLLFCLLNAVSFAAGSWQAQELGALHIAVPRKARRGHRWLGP